MIQKTAEEKAAIKAAKNLWKQKNNIRHSGANDEKIVDTKPGVELILTGLMEGEEVLPDDFPVHFDYTYVSDSADGGHSVIISRIKGTVKELKEDMFRKIGFRPANIYNCKHAARNIF